MNGREPALPTADDPVAPPPSRRTLALLAVAGVVFYALNVDFRLNGDAAMYADYVLRGQFNELTLHLGYYALLFAADRTVGALLGLPIYETSVWLNVLAGALCLPVVYLLALHFLRDQRDAWLCVLIFAVSGRVLANATSSEIYMVELLLVLLSFHLFVRERALAAGIVAGAALLVSPLSAFAYLFFPVLDYQRAGGIRWPVLLRLAAGVLAVYVPFLAFDAHELLFGLRGLLHINQLMVLDPWQSLRNFPIYAFKTFSVLLLLLIPACRALRANLRFLVLSLAVILPHFYIILKLTGEDHVFILNGDFFVCVWLVLGWRELRKLRFGRLLAPALLTGHLVLLFSSGAIFGFRSYRGYAAELRAIADDYIVGRDAVLVTDWGMRVVFPFYGRPAPTSVIREEPLYRQMLDIENYLPEDSVALNAAEIYLLDPWKPSALNRLLRSDAGIAAQREQHSVLGRATRMFQLRCDLLAQATNRFYRCGKAPPRGPG